MFVKKENHNRDGFMSVVIFLVMTAVLLWCASLWLGINRMSDLVLAKQKYEKEFWLTQGALSCAVANVKDLMTTYADQVPRTYRKNEYVLDPWPLHENNDKYSARVSYKIYNKEADLIAKLLQQGHIKRKLSCTLKQDKKDPKKFFIVGWQEHAKR